MLTIVSGSNDIFFPCLKQLLNNLKKYSEGIRIVIYDLGLKIEQKIILKETNSNFIWEELDYNQYPEHVNLSKYHCNTYAFKPIVIDDACQKYRGFLAWFDSSVLFQEDFSELVNIIKNHGLYSPRSNRTIRQMTHPRTFSYFNLKSRDYSKKILDLNQRHAGLFGINYNLKWCQNLIREWKDLSLIKDCICPPGSTRDNHRQDQSIWSLLFYKYQRKYKFKIINHFINFTVHNKEVLKNT